MDDARFHATGGAGYRRRPFRLNGVEALAAPLEQNADQIDDDVGIARRGLDRLRKAHIRLHRFYLPDSPERLQMAGQLRAAHRDANTVLAVGERAHHMAADEARAAEHRDQRVRIAFDSHAGPKYRIDSTLYRAITR